MGTKWDGSYVASKCAYPIGKIYMWQVKQEKKNRARYSWLI